MALILSSGKREMTIDPPWMNAAGFLGFEPPARSPFPIGRLGAFVTPPISLGRRTPARLPRLLEFPGGFCLHTGHPNPGISEVVRRNRRQWKRHPRPILANLLPENLSDLERLLRRLELLEEVMAVELGLGQVSEAEGADWIGAAAAFQFPAIAQFPLGTDPKRAAPAVAAGAAAVSLGPPRGSVLGPDQQRVTGRLYGPSIFPWALQAVSDWVPQLPVPLIASGGIYSTEARDALIAAGAAGVQLDGILWVRPESVLGPDE